MYKKPLSILLVVAAVVLGLGALNLAIGAGARGTDPAAGECFSQQESELYRLINDFRAEHDLPRIPASPSLTLVAHRHADDLAAQGQLSHVWRDCPYDASDSATYPCMWEAPRRLGTQYPGFGYENAHWHSDQATAKSAFEGWKTSTAGHREVILNQGPWEREWRAIGLAVRGRYAVLWVGHEPDPVAPCR